MCMFRFLCISHSAVVFYVNVVSWLIQNSCGMCVCFLVGVYAVHCVGFSLRTFVIVFACSVSGCSYILTGADPETSLFFALCWFVHDGVCVLNCACSSVYVCLVACV